MTAGGFSDTEKKITLAGVIIVFLLSALDQTIVSTAMPVIISELHGLELYAWVTTAYLLSSTVTVPIWGKLGDIYGRKAILLWGIGIFLAGSWLAGLAGEFGDMPLLGGGMTQLIVFRALQGIGGGALFTTAFAIIADLYPPRERGRFAGVLGSVFGVASAIGPLLGGYFTDHGTVTLFGHVIAGWRWVFYLNLPLGLVSLFMVAVKMPHLPHAARGKIDVLGAIFLVCAFVPLLLALTFGGHAAPWISPLVLGLFGGAAAALGLFLWAETKAADPILPLDLFKNKVFRWANAAGFFSSMSFLSVLSFLPLFLQLGQGIPATQGGLAMLPLMVGLIVSARVAGQQVTKTGKYKRYMLGGAGLMLVAGFLLSRIDVDTSQLDLAWRMALLGVALGPMQSLFSLAVQNAAPMERLGVVTSANQFFRQIGSTVGVAVFGALLTNTLNASLAAKYPGLDLTKLRSLSAEGASVGAALDLPLPARAMICDAVAHVIFLSLAVAIVALVAVTRIPELPMRETPKAPPKGEPTPDAHL